MKTLPCILVLLCWAMLPPVAAASQQQKPPPGVDLKMTSDDPAYGYSRDKPIKVGSKDHFGGPEAEKTYFRGLRDEKGEPVEFRRLASVGQGPDGNILDLYQVTTSTGKTVELYIDMYHPNNPPDKQLAPKGFFKARTKPV